VPGRELAPHPEPPRPPVRGHAQDAEWDRDLRRPLAAPALRRRLPHAVPLEVGIAGEDAVELHAPRVHAEDVRALPVAVGVQVERDVVAVQHLIARRQARVRRALCLAPDAEHDPLAVAQHTHRGGLVGYLALARADQLEGARDARALPRRLVERAVYV